MDIGRARLRRFVDVGPDEAPRVLLTFLYIATVVASFILAKAVRNGLFLAQFGAYKLVYVYVGVPVLLSLFVPIYARSVARFGQRAVISGSLVFFIFNVLAFWVLFRFRPRPLLSALFYVWVNCYGVIAPVQVWNFANSIFDTRQAKRLFGLIGSGASAGAIAGGLLARWLVGPLGGAINLLLVLAALIGLATFFVSLTRRVIPRRPPSSRPEDPRGLRLARTLRLVAHTPYLRRIAALVFLVAVVTQWTQFQFLLVAQQRHFGDADRLTAFLGGFNVYFGIVAMLVQLLLTGTVLRRFGIAVTILLLPLSLGLGSTLVLFFPAFWSVLLTNSFDQSLRFSIDKASFELLYLPLAPEVRSDVKATIDMIFNRVADAAGGLLLGLATQGFNLGIVRLPGAGFGLRGTAAICLAMIVAWVFVAFGLRRGYVDAIRETIRRHRLDAQHASAPFLDRSTTEILAGRLAAGDEQEILYALGLFEMQHRQATHPALRSLLGHASPAVRRRALSILDAAGDTSVMPAVEAMLLDESLETRTEALCYLTHHAGIDPLVRIRELGDFEDYSVRAAMVSFLARPGKAQNLDAASVLLDGMVQEPGPQGRRARLEAARLIGTLPASLAGSLRRLIGDPDRDVARTAVQSAGRLRRPDLVPDLLAGLDTELADETTQALAEMGDTVVGPLRDRLFDPAVATDLKRRIPPVLVRIGTPLARRALTDGLLHGDPALRLRIISSLNKLSRTGPAAAADVEMVETVLAAEIMGHYRSYQIVATLARHIDPDDSALLGLRESMDQEIERIFRLLALLVPGDDLHSAYVALKSPDPSARSNALELLDNILAPALRQLVVPLLDSQVGVDGRAALADRIVGAPVESREEAVVALMACGDTWLRSCAARAIGSLGLTSLEPELDRWLDDPDPLLRETARSAKLQLVGAAEEQAAGGASVAGGWESSERLGVG